MTRGSNYDTQIIPGHGSFSIQWPLCNRVLAPFDFELSGNAAFKQVSRPSRVARSSSFIETPWQGSLRSVVEVSGLDGSGRPTRWRDRPG